MSYIIDGHNLVPRIPGLRLDAPDDEEQLIKLLQEFCRLSRKKVEVYFDNAPAGQARASSFGLVSVRFVRTGSSADEAIHNRLLKMGRAARSWRVVSSDQRVQDWARQSGAQPVASEDFTRLLQETLGKQGLEASKQPDLRLSPDEVNSWLQVFEQPPENKGKKRKPG